MILATGLGTVHEFRCLRDQNEIITTRATLPSKWNPELFYQVMAADVPSSTEPGALQMAYSPPGSYSLNSLLCGAPQAGGGTRSLA